MATELRRLGAERVHIVGGEAAVSAAVADDLEELGLDVVRIAGADRFATAAAAARAAGAAPSGDVLLALGAHPDPVRAWPDALSAGAYAALDGRPPLLLATQDGLPDATQVALAELVGETGTVHVVGGPGALSDAVLTQLAELGYAAIRLAGDNRFATSTETAADVLRRLPPQPRPLILASGANFPDGLAAAALAARIDGLLLLVPGTTLEGAATASWLRAAGPSVAEVVVVGGSAAVSDEVANGAAATVDGPAVTLPAPAATPAGTPEQVADALALALSAEPRQATPPAVAQEDDHAATLLAALSGAGYTVLDSTGATVAAPADEGQRLVVEAWQVAALAEGPAAQLEQPLDAFLGGFRPAADVLAELDLADLVLQDVRAAAADPASAHHAWALLLAALGRKAPVPHDLLVDPPAQIQLTFTQLTLLLTTMAGDLRTWAGADAASRSLAQAPAGARPCRATPDATEDVILGFGSAGYSYGYGKLLDAITEAVESSGLERFSRGTAVAGVVLAYLQAALAVNGVEYTGRTAPDPATRTRSHTADGDPAVFTAQMRYDIEKSEVFDCLRLVLRAMNLDLDIPDSGPLPGSEVRFLIRDFEGATAGTAPFFGQGTGEALTDANGEAQYGIVGRRQPDELPADAVQREAVFDLVVYGKINANNLVKDIPGILTDSAGGVTTLLTLPATLLTRTEWSAPGGFDVPYLDWDAPCPQGGSAKSSAQETCGAAVTGTIETTQTIREEPDEVGYTRDDTTRGTVQVSLQRDPSRPALYVDAGSSYDVTREIVDVFRCGDGPDAERVTSLQGSGAFTNTPGTPTIVAQEEDGELSVTILTEVSGTATTQECNGNSFTEDVEPMEQRLTCGTQLLGRFVAQNADGSRVVDMTCDDSETDPDGLSATESARGTLTVR